MCACLLRQDTRCLRGNGFADGGIRLGLPGNAPQINYHRASLQVRRLHSLRHVDLLWFCDRPFLNFFALSLSFYALFSSSSLLLLLPHRATAGCTINQSFVRSFTQLEAHSHVAFTMRFYSPALAAFSLLSLSAVRLHVGALQLDPTSPGTFSVHGSCVTIR